jgi:hypothetical protein
LRPAASWARSSKPLVAVGESGSRSAAALNDVRDGDLDDEIRLWRPVLAEPE